MIQVTWRILLVHRRNVAGEIMPEERFMHYRREETVWIRCLLSSFFKLFDAFYIIEQFYWKKI